MQEERRLAVLRAIVEDYVTTEEPVGSEGTGGAPRPGRVAGDGAQRHGGAGGRGYITQPHTSAGRVPTDKGYRLSSTG